MIFEKELELFESKKEELLKHNKGQFVLIFEKDLLGTFTTEKEAYEEGLRKVGNRPFLIKQILPGKCSEEIPAYTLGLLSGNIQ